MSHWVAPSVESGAGQSGFCRLALKAHGRPPKAPRLLFTAYSLPRGARYLSAAALCGGWIPNAPKCFLARVGVYVSPTHSGARPGGGIGRHAGLRSLYLTVWGFESPPGHHLSNWGERTYLRPTADLPVDVANRA